MLPSEWLGKKIIFWRSARTNFMLFHSAQSHSVTAAALNCYNIIDATHATIIICRSLPTYPDVPVLRSFPRKIDEYSICHPCQIYNSGWMCWPDQWPENGIAGAAIFNYFCSHHRRCILSTNRSACIEQNKKSFLLQKEADNPVNPD